MAVTAETEQPSTSGGAGDELPLGSKYAGLQPSKIRDAVAALLKYVSADATAEKVLFQEDELLYLVGSRALYDASEDGLPGCDTTTSCGMRLPPAAAVGDLRRPHVSVHRRSLR